MLFDLDDANMRIAELEEETDNGPTYDLAKYRDAVEAAEREMAEVRR
jgi:hypothetical protein